MQKLLLSLDVPSPEELREDWLAEAKRGAMELDDGKVQAIPGDDVLSRARALLR
jgi:hypothetical protein